MSLLNELNSSYPIRMAISYKLPLFLVLGIGATVGGWYFFINGTNNSDAKTTKTVAYRLGESLILFSENSSKWEARKTSLSSANDETLVDDLKNIKGGTDQQLKDWCIVNSSSTFEDENDKRFLNVKSYCTYRIRDKLSKDVRERDDNNWEQASLYLKLPGIVLSSKMKGVKEKDASDGYSTGDALKNWCNDNLDSMYENNSDFKDADSYCTIF